MDDDGGEGGREIKKLVICGLHKWMTPFGFESKNIWKQVQIKRPVEDKLKSTENGSFIKRQGRGTSSDNISANFSLNLEEDL